MPLKECPSTRNLVRGIRLTMTAASASCILGPLVGLDASQAIFSGRNTQKAVRCRQALGNHLSNDPPAMPIHSLVLQVMRDVTASAMYHFRGILPWRHTVQTGGSLSPILASLSRKHVDTRQRDISVTLCGACDWCISAFSKVLTLRQLYLF
jgi:hypothetical protein